MSLIRSILQFRLAGSEFDKCYNVYFHDLWPIRDYSIKYASDIVGAPKSVLLSSCFFHTLCTLTGCRQKICPVTLSGTGALFDLTSTCATRLRLAEDENVQPRPYLAHAEIRHASAGSFIGLSDEGT